MSDPTNPFQDRSEVQRAITEEVKPRPTILCASCGGTGVIFVGRQGYKCGPCAGRGWRHG